MVLIKFLHFNSTEKVQKAVGARWKEKIVYGGRHIIYREMRSFLGWLPQCHITICRAPHVEHHMITKAIRVFLCEFIPIDWLSVKFHSNRLSRIHVRTSDLSVRGYTIYNVGLCLWPMRWEGCLSWHTWCDTEPWSTRSHPKDRSACFLMGQARCTQDLLYPQTQGRYHTDCDYAIYNLWTRRFCIYICSLITSFEKRSKGLVDSWIVSNILEVFSIVYESWRHVDMSSHE